MIIGYCFHIFLAAGCTSRGEFIGRTVLSLVFFYVGWIFLVAGRKGKIRFTFHSKLEDHKRLAIRSAIFLWVVGLVVLLSTVTRSVC
jgi:hypothetical protein